MEEIAKLISTDRADGIRATKLVVDRAFFSPSIASAFLLWLDEHEASFDALEKPFFPALRKTWISQIGLLPPAYPFQHIYNYPACIAICDSLLGVGHHQIECAKADRSMTDVGSSGLSPTISAPSIGIDRLPDVMHHFGLWTSTTHQVFAVGSSSYPLHPVIFATQSPWLCPSPVACSIPVRCHGHSIFNTDLIVWRNGLAFWNTVGNLILILSAHNIHSHSRILWLME